MDKLIQFMDMGGHGPFIWSSYGMVFVVLLGLWIVSLRYLRASRDELSGLDVERPHRGRGQTDET